MKIKTTKVEVPANTELGTPAKTLYYLVIINEKTNKQHNVNIGEKTYNAINKIHDSVVGDLLDDGKLNKSNKQK